jgi:hypothetical protein
MGFIKNSATRESELRSRLPRGIVENLRINNRRRADDDPYRSAHRHPKSTDQVLRITTEHSFQAKSHAHWVVAAAAAQTSERVSRDFTS